VQLPDRALPEAAPPFASREALQVHIPKALNGFRYEYDGDRTVYLWLTARKSTGETDEYLVRLVFLHYPDWPPSVTFLNPDTRQYDGTHWPGISGSQRLAFHARYGDAPVGMVCNSMTFEYYFWGGHNPPEDIRWSKVKHTFAATVAELVDHLNPPFYQGRQT
jgi:hypothetical protein